MRILTSILLGLLAALMLTASWFLATDGNLAGLTGWYHYRSGDPLFPDEITSQLDKVSWMRIRDLHDTIECERDRDGEWWIVSPFRDRMSREAVESILLFTDSAKIVDTLPMNNTVKGNMREFGLDTTPHTITLKIDKHNGAHTKLASYTLGSISPWLDDAGDGKNVQPTTYLCLDSDKSIRRIHVVTGSILGIFKDGLPALRDSQPLRITPEELRRVSVQHEDGAQVTLSRATAEENWVVTSPVLATAQSADQTLAEELVNSLARLNAMRVEDDDDVTLPARPETVITLENAEGGKVELKLYKSFLSAQDAQQVCYATVSDRAAVFTLRAAPKVNRHGPYSTIIKSVYQLPVLNRQSIAQNTVYTDELPLRLEQLRSMSFADVDAQNVGSFSLRRKKNNPRFTGDRTALRMELISGNPDSGIEDVWVASSDGREVDAETDVVRNFITSLKDIPATEILADLRPGGNARDLANKYGFNDPTYVLMVAPRPCAFRATLYGHDLPLVRTHDPRIFLVNRYRDPQTGESMWVGMENGGTTIYKLSTKLTRLFSPDLNRWRKRNLINFPLSSLYRLTMDYQRAPLVLDYNYLGEAWTGTLGGKDVSAYINTSRAEHYVRHLQRIKVRQWLPAHDESANAALRRPVFSVKLDLEITDYSDVADAVVDSTADIPDIDSEEIQRWLNDDDETGRTMRDMATKERATRKVTRTIEIAPMDVASDQPDFYGRIKETGDIFILNFTDAQSLGSNPLDL